MQCVQASADGFLQIAQQGAADCQFYLIQAGETFGWQSLFDPSWLTENGGADLLQQMFMLGLKLVVVPFIAAFFFGELLDFVNRDNP